MFTSSDKGSKAHGLKGVFGTLHLCAFVTFFLTPLALDIIRAVGFEFLLQTVEIITDNILQ
jgi:hypothetical protein